MTVCRQVGTPKQQARRKSAIFGRAGGGCCGHPRSTWRRRIRTEGLPLRGVVLLGAHEGRDRVDSGGFPGAGEEHVRSG